MSGHADIAGLLADPANEWMCLADNGARPVEPPRWLRDIAATQLSGPDTLEHLDPATHRYAIAAFLEALQHGTASSIATRADTGTHVRVNFFDSSLVAEAFTADVQDDERWFLLVSVDTDQLPTAADDEQVELPVRVLRSRLDAAARRIWIDEENLETLLGWAPELLVGQSAIDLLHPDDRERSIAAFAELLNQPGGQSRFRCRYLRPDGPPAWFEVTHTNLLHTDDPHIDVVALDISAEMTTHSKLEARETLMTALTEALPVGVLHLDHEQQTTIVNPAWHELTGTVSDGIDALICVIDEPERVTKAIESATQSGDPSTIAVQLNSPAAKCLHGDLHLRPLDDAHGHTAMLITLTDTTAAIALQENLERLARLDHLTQVPNRLGLENELSAALNASPESVTLLFIDVNNFKHINDSLGHATGDVVLVEVAEAIRRTLRSSDLVARIGGDEFAVLLLNATPDDTERAVARVSDRLDEVRSRLGLTIPLSVSIGVAVSSEDDDFDSLLRRADSAMYRNKHGVDPAAD